jgi:hypothetical protein
MNDSLFPASRPARFARSEHGFFTAFSLYALIVMILLTGFALDLANHYSARAQLQVAADTAAHAAIVVRYRDGVDEGKAAALAINAANMAPDRYGMVLTEDEIEFGRWNFATRVFEPHATVHTAARATTRQTSGRANELRTFLLRFAGVGSFNVGATAVFARYQPACLREGFVAEGRVDMQSNNTFLNGFCIHSNDHVRINQNNFFEEGTIVSMPDLDKLDVPNSGFEKNEGLEAALREGRIDIRILGEFDNIRTGLLDRDADYLPGYVNPADPVVYRNLTSNNNSLTAADFPPNRVHSMTCTSGNGRITVPNNTVIRDVVIVTNCPISLGQSVQLQDVVLFTTSTRSDSVEGASGVNLGKPDDCAPGGGVQILTMGGMRFPASMGIFGGQLLAQGSIEFAARADGIQGASMISGGEIDGTSNSNMSLCGTGMEGNYEADYFRMVM